MVGGARLPADGAGQLAADLPTGVWDVTFGGGDFGRGLPAVSALGILQVVDAGRVTVDVEAWPSPFSLSVDGTPITTVPDSVRSLEIRFEQGAHTGPWWELQPGDEVPTSVMLSPGTWDVAVNPRPKTAGEVWPSRGLRVRSAVEADGLGTDRVDLDPDQQFVTSADLTNTPSRSASTWLTPGTWRVVAHLGDFQRPHERFTKDLGLIVMGHADQTESWDIRHVPLDVYLTLEGAELPEHGDSSNRGLSHAAGSADRLPEPPPPGPAAPPGRP